MISSFRILGIDPGLERTGYGLIEVEPDQSSRLKAQGIFKSSRTLPLEERLDILHAQLSAFLEEQNPDVVVLEQLYSHYDHPVTAILMGHARGIICLAAAQKKILLVSYAATRVKKAVTGNGGASKEQVQRMVCHLLGVKTLSSPFDVTDALALAMAHANIARQDLATKKTFPRSRPRKTFEVQNGGCGTRPALIFGTRNKRQISAGLRQSSPKTPFWTSHSGPMSLRKTFSSS